LRYKLPPLLGQQVVVFVNDIGVIVTEKFNSPLVGQSHTLILLYGYNALHILIVPLDDGTEKIGQETHHVALHVTVKLL
jgi:hypothetical protein